MEDVTSDTAPPPSPAASTSEAPTLFPLPPAAPATPRPLGPNPKRGARLREAERSQISWGRIDLNATLPEDHPARAMWAVVGRLDLSALYAQIEARDEVAGAPAIDPQILLSLWIYATSEGGGQCS